MNKIVAWIDALPLPMFAVLSVMLALAPFVPMPHLQEKILMLFAGELVKPLDIFDLFMHGTPISLLLLRLFRQFVLKISR